MTKKGEGAYKEGLFSVGTAARRLAAPIVGRKGFLFADISARWRDIVGETADGSFPDKITFPVRGESQATLHIKTVSGAHAAVLTAEAGEIIEKINAFAGAGTIKSLRVTQGARPKRAPVEKTPVFTEPTPEQIARIDDIVKNVDNEMLRDTLRRLGILIAGKKQ